LQADKILSDDEDLVSDKNSMLKNFLVVQKGKTVWSKIS
jgi:hypothetical protein